VLKALSAKLSALGVLADSEAKILERLHRQIIDYSAGTVVQREQATIESTGFIISGWGVRFRTAPDGRRQIVNFLLPGDGIGLYGALFEKSDSGMQMITDATLAQFSSAELLDVFHESARLGAALCWMASQEERVLEQQILRAGALHATSRLAHLLVDLQLRALQAGAPLAEASSMPITRELIAEALGVSQVHANRCCRELVKQDLIEVSETGLKLLEPGGLERLSSYWRDLSS